MRDVLKGKHRQGDAQSHLHRYQRLSFFLWTTTENNHIRPLPDSSPPPPPRNWGCQEREISLPYHAPFPTHWIQPNPYAPPCTHRTLQEDISQTRTSSSGRPTASSHPPPPPLSVPETFARSFVSRPKWNPTQETLPLGTNLSHKRTRSGHSFVFRLLSCWAAGLLGPPPVRHLSYRISLMSRLSADIAWAPPLERQFRHRRRPSPLVSSFPLLHQC